MLCYRSMYLNLHGHLYQFERQRLRVSMSVHVHISVQVKEITVIRADVILYEEINKLNIQFQQPLSI